jgi:hypothetical protein
MAIELILPVPRRQTAAAAKMASHVWRAPPDNPVVGLVDNAKAHTAELFDAIGRRFVSRGVAASYFVWQKRSAGMAMTPNERDNMLARAHVIVSGMGD